MSMQFGDDCTSRMGGADDMEAAESEGFDVPRLR